MTNDDIKIIAEIAQGYEGKVEQAKLLLRAAAYAGADAGKLQVIYADEMSTPDYVHHALFSSLEMTDDDWRAIADYSEEVGLELYLDIFGEKSLLLAEKISPKGIMLHATDINNLFLLQLVSRCSIPLVLLNIGGAYRSEIQRAINYLENKHIVLMHGFQSYPTPTNDNNISRIVDLITSFSQSNHNITIGFADHSLPESNIHLSLSAIALGCGARFFEKHITLGEVMRLEDYDAAINPDRFASYIQNLKNCMEAYGGVSQDDDFSMHESEKKYRKQIRKHVVTNKDMKKGININLEDIVLKRTSESNAITEISDAIDRVLICDIKANMPLLESYFLKKGEY